ncbi:hypothetical protein NEUTE2DRAFT_123518 [Neurospora tetrasperma FGSC 2509]|nr:hypothetical protein NEUTE2DRAFT_123518 [Neurospora tetrasperma FGSC 2509]
MALRTSSSRREYHCSYYPNHSQERVDVTRSGNTVNIAVMAGGNAGKFKKASVVINIGGMQNQPYLSAGIATGRFGYTSMAPNSNSKTGAFWDT